MASHARQAGARSQGHRRIRAPDRFRSCHRTLLRQVPVRLHPGHRLPAGRLDRAQAGAARLDGGLLAWKNRDASAPDSAAATPPPRSGMPGWGIALVVIGVCVFLLLPVAAILAAIAIPTYQSYMVRSEVVQGLDLTDRARSLVAEYIGQRGALPNSNDALGLPKPEAIHARYVSSVRVIGGKVVVTYG